MCLLVASHTMPSPDEMFGAPAVVLSVLVSGTATLVAGFGGARAVGRLPWPRHGVAAAAGAALGGLALAGAILLATHWLPALAAALAVLALGSVGGPVLAFRMARGVAARLSWYRCPVCGVPFQSRAGPGPCGPCAARKDRDQVAQALAEFDARCRALR
jgi:hypothetical protein